MVIGLAFFTAKASAITADDLVERSVSIGNIYVNKASGDDNNSGGVGAPIATLREAIKRSYAFGRANVHLAAGTYSASNDGSPGGRLRISGHPELFFFGGSTAFGQVKINAAFTILNGAKVTFRDLHINQRGNIGSLPQILAENSRVDLDDIRATYFTGAEGQGLIRGINSYINIRATANTSRNLHISYGNYDGDALSIVEVDYGSYLFIGSARPNQRVDMYVTVKPQRAAISVYGSGIHAANLRIQGNVDNRNTGFGLLLNRGSSGRVLEHTCIDGIPCPLQSYIYRFNKGVTSQNGSTVYFSGPIRVTLNNTGLEAQSGGDIRYSDEVDVVGNSKNTNTSPPANILKAY